MAEKNIIMQRKKSDGTYDMYYPKTKAGLVEFADGTTVEAHKADYLPHLFQDGSKIYKWGLSVSNGVVMFNYEEV